MQNRSQVINRLALLLLSIVVLELVLIGDQVQPVKAIKKKIALKKLKKLLPLLALVKPKKKIIVVPVSFPPEPISAHRFVECLTLLLILDCAHPKLIMFTCCVHTTDSFSHVQESRVSS